MMTWDTGNGVQSGSCSNYIDIVCCDVAKDCRGQKAPRVPDLSYQAVILVENRTAIVTLVTRLVPIVHRSVCTVSAVV
jgi:hypothetical protein